MNPAGTKRAIQAALATCAIQPLAVAATALIAEYQTALPDKQLLRRKLHEFYQLALPHAAPTPRKRRQSPKP